MLYGRFELSLGRQCKAQGVLDQGNGLSRLLLGLGTLEGLLEVIGGLAIQPLAQLHGSQLIEAGGIAGLLGALALQASQGDFITPHPPDLTAHGHGGHGKQDYQADQVGLGQKRFHSDLPNRTFQRGLSSWRRPPRW